MGKSVVSLGNSAGAVRFIFVVREALIRLRLQGELTFTIPAEIIVYLVVCAAGCI